MSESSRNTRRDQVKGRESKPKLVDRKYRFAPRPRTEGYTPLPNQVLYDVTLSAAARLLYAMLSDLAAFTHEEPEQDELAEKMACSGKTLRGYMAELTSAGLVKSVRRGRGLTNAYVVYHPANRSEDKNGKNYRSRKGENYRSRTVEITEPTRARDPSGKTQTEDESPSDSSPPAAPSAGEVPPLTKDDDGRNVAWDALVEATDDSERMQSGRIAAALKKIRAAYAEDNPFEGFGRDARLAWERALADEIRLRARLYVETMPSGTMLTSTALASWWDRVVKKAQGRISQSDWDAIIAGADELKRRIG